MTPSIKEALELLPCPFCGSAAEIERGNDHHGEWFNLGCSCHWGNVEPDSACSAGRMWYTAEPEDEPKAIATWNTRATLSPPAGERREAIARAVRFFIDSEVVTMKYGFKYSIDAFEKLIDDLASGLVQDEAAIRADEREKCANNVPTSWLDPLLSGPDKVGSLPFNGLAVERLLQGIVDRIRSARDGVHES